MTAAGAGTTRSVAHHDLAAAGLPVVEGPTVLYLWWRDLPLGEVGFASPPSPGWLASELARAVAPAVTERLQPGAIGNWLPGEKGRPGRASARVLAAGPPLERLDDLAVVRGTGVDASDLTVIVCTRHRPASLRRTLVALRSQLAPPGQIVVVDNGPDDGTVPGVLADFPEVRGVAEPRPGLSVARNTGLRATTTPLIAFTDDDAEPHPAWSAQVVRALRRPGAPMALTGLVLPADLASVGAATFEDVTGFGQGYLPRCYDPRWFRGQRWGGTPVWKVGAGANMAFRREAFDLVGGYDERLGAGASGCSEDSELWYRLLAAGASIAYEPAAVVLHHHRDDLDELERLFESYSEGHVSALFVQFQRSRHPGDLGRVAVRLPLHHASGWRRDRRDPLLRAERRGFRRGVRRHWRAALERFPVPDVTPDASEVRSVRRSDRGPFLRANPFPHPLTEGFFYREKMRAIHRVAPEGPVRRVLELGGGRSGLTELLYPGAEVVNVDLDAVYGRDAASTGTPFVVADATALPFPAGAFDLVTMFDLLEHVPADDAAANEARRVVRPGGAVLLSTPTSRWRYPSVRALRPICPPGAELMAEWGHVRVGYDHGRLTELFGGPPDRTASFISPVTAIAHDLAFARLPGRVRRLLIGLLLPVTWLGYLVHRPSSRGTEVAAVWRR